MSFLHCGDPGISETASSMGNGKSSIQSSIKFLVNYVKMINGELPKDDLNRKGKQIVAGTYSCNTLLSKTKCLKLILAGSLLMKV